MATKRHATGPAVNSCTAPLGYHNTQDQPGDPATRWPGGGGVRSASVKSNGEKAGNCGEIVGRMRCRNQNPPKPQRATPLHMGTHRGTKTHASWAGRKGLRENGRKLRTLADLNPRPLVQWRCHAHAATSEALRRGSHAPPGARRADGRGGQRPHHSAIAFIRRVTQVRGRGTSWR